VGLGSLVQANKRATAQTLILVTSESSTSRPTPAGCLPGGNVASTTAKQRGFTDRLASCGDGSPVTDIRPAAAGSSEVGGQRSQKARRSRRKSGACQMLEAEHGPRCPSTDSTGVTANPPGRGTQGLSRVQVEDGGRQKPEQQGGSSDEKRPPTETETGQSGGSFPSLRQVRTPADRAEDYDSTAALGESMARGTLAQHQKVAHEGAGEIQHRTLPLVRPCLTRWDCDRKCCGKVMMKIKILRRLQK